LRGKPHLGYGVIYALIAAFLFASLGALIKVAAASVSPPIVLFFRQLFSTAILSPYIIWWIVQEGKTIFEPSRLRAQLVRAFASVAAAYCVVFAIALLPLSDAITLSYTRPLFLPFVIWLWAGKRVEGPVWLGVILGFIGVVFILKPAFYSLEAGTFVGLASGVLGAIAVLLVRQATKVEPPLHIMAYYFVASTIITALPLPFLWQTPRGAGVWLTLVAIGILGVLDQLFLTLAYRNGRASVVSVVLYATVLFTFVWDLILWGTLPDWWSIVGMALICCGAIISLLFSHSQAAPGEQPGVSESDKNP
jgi:drug/metabolite transporter (DMT)-like permease